MAYLRRQRITDQGILESSPEDIVVGEYSITVGPETLTAKLIEGPRVVEGLKDEERRENKSEIKREIQIHYANEQGDRNISIIRGGLERFVGGAYGNGNFKDKNDGIIDLDNIYKRLGPLVRQHIPSDWREVLGRWLQ
ncbi:MAG TPA: hypothetical protein VJI98_04155 [Candidatus Nanoarchaeia archaeon]|nr:hypothetical protein [Candidatus Nanoarchaeia archaeon]